MEPEQCPSDFCYTSSMKVDDFAAGVIKFEELGEFK